MSILKMLRESTEPLTVAEVAGLMAVTAATVQRWVRNRQIPFIRIGGVLRRCVTVALDEASQLLALGATPNEPTVQTGKTLVGERHTARYAQHCKARLCRTEHCRSAAAILDQLAVKDLLALTFWTLLHRPLTLESSQAATSIYSRVEVGFGSG